MFIILAPLIKQNKSLIISDLYGSGAGNLRVPFPGVAYGFLLTVATIEILVIYS